MVTTEKRREILGEGEGVVTKRGAPKPLEMRCPQKGGTSDR